MAGWHPDDQIAVREQVAAAQADHVAVGEAKAAGEGGSAAVREETAAGEGEYAAVRNPHCSPLCRADYAHRRTLR